MKIFTDFAILLINHLKIKPSSKQVESFIRSSVEAEISFIDDLAELSGGSLFLGKEISLKMLKMHTQDEANLLLNDLDMNKIYIVDGSNSWIRSGLKEILKNDEREQQPDTTSHVLSNNRNQNKDLKEFSLDEMF